MNSPTPVEKYITVTNIFRHKNVKLNQRSHWIHHCSDMRTYAAGNNNHTLTRLKCTFYLCFPTLAALDSKRILSELASLHIFHKCTKMCLLTALSFYHLHFHHPRNYRHVLRIERSHRIGIQTNILELTSWTIWHHEYAARLLSAIQNGGAQWWIFCSFGEEFHWDRMHYGSSNNDQ